MVCVAASGSVCLVRGCIWREGGGVRERRTFYIGFTLHACALAALRMRFGDSTDLLWVFYGFSAGALWMHSRPRAVSHLVVAVTAVVTAVASRTAQVASRTARSTARP